MERTRSIVVSGALCIFAACGAVPANAASLNPCSLLTEGQVSAALGVPVGLGSPTMAMNRCEWLPKNHMNKGSVDLSLETARGLAAAKMSLGRQETTVSGVGDDAVQDTTQGVRTVLTVKKGNTYFAIRVSGLPVEQAKAAEKTLALEIVANL